MPADAPPTRRGRRAGDRSTVATRIAAGVASLLAGASLAAVIAVVATVVVLVATPGPAAAQGVEPPPDVPEPGIEIPDVPPVGAPADDDGSGITIDIGGNEEPSQTVLLIVGLSLLSLAPSLVIMLTSFTRIVVLLSMTRNALGLQGVPPNQVVIGLSLFLSLFVMAPTLSAVNDDALQPFLDGRIDQAEAYEVATEPMRKFMLDNTRTAELDLMMDATPGGRPGTIDDVGMTTVIPAFVLSELKTAFVMGFVIFIPFLIIDLVVASVLMSLGMMMLPPVFVSLPFKLLLFVMVGGWSLVVETLLASYA